MISLPRTPFKQYEEDEVTLETSFSGRPYFFYGGYFSNFAATPFKDASERKFSCSEQYMMYHKAKFFYDDATAALIMATDDPHKQKLLGRQVQDFQKEKWETVARSIVYEGCYYKFTQNQSAYDRLMSTYDRLLVEASPSDTIWGIGLGMDDDKKEDVQNWRGTNWLGLVLTQLRIDIEGFTKTPQ